MSHAAVKSFDRRGVSCKNARTVQSSDACSIHTIVTKIIMRRQNGVHLKDGLLLGGAVCYAGLFCLPRHSYVTTPALRKQVHACVRSSIV